MKLIYTVYYKLKMMLCDRLFFTAMIVIPLFITIAAGFALRYEKMDTVPVALVDEDHSEYSSLLIKRVSMKEGLKVEEADRKAALSMLDGSNVEQVFIIKKGFESDLQNGDREGLIDVINSPLSYSAGFTREAVAGEVIRLVTDNTAANWVEDQYRKLGKPVGKNLREEVIDYNESLWEPEPLMTIDYKELEGKTAADAKKHVLPAAAATSAGVLAAFIMFYILFSSGWLVEERTNGTIKRLAAGPHTLLLSYTGSILALTISGVIQIFIFCFVDTLIFKVRLFTGILSFAVWFAYLLCVLSISMFLSSVLKTQSQLQSGAPVIALLTGFAGGCFWNFVQMPERIRRLSLFTPQGWALEGINRLMTGSADLTAVLGPVMVLLIIPLILLPLSYIIINMQLRYQ